MLKSKKRRLFQRPIFRRMFSGGPTLPRDGLIGEWLVRNGLTDSIGISSILFQSGDASTWLTTAVWGFGYNATMATLNTNLGGNKLFLGTTPIYRTWAEWMDQPWMNQTFLWMGERGAAAWSTNQAANVARINRALRYVDVDTDAIPAELALLWNASDVLVSRTGPPAAFASAGSTPDGSGGVLSANVPCIHTIDGRKLMDNGPAHVNLFAGNPTGAEVKTLTAQKYCLQCFGAGGSVDAGAYGVATTGNPLQFTALAANQTFTPNGSVTAWQLTASGGYIFPYVAPGVSVASRAGTVGLNGTTWPMSGSAAADKLKDCFQGTGGVGPAVCTAAVLVRMGVSSTEIPASAYPGILSVTGATSSLLYGAFTATRQFSTYDGTNSIQTTPAYTSFARGAFILLVVNTKSDGTQWRIGIRRYSSAMVPVDSGINWSSWVNFDGSFNPINTLILALNFPAPHWTAQVQAWKSSAAEADVLKWCHKYYPVGA